MTMTETEVTAEGCRRTAQTADDAFARLMEAIISGELPGGMPLREAQLARVWEVGRTPLREAVRRAAEAGFLLLRHNQAPVVRKLNRRDVAELYELREILELNALRMAWPKLSVEVVKDLKATACRATPHTKADWREDCLAFDLELHGCWGNECGNSWLTADLARQYQFLRIMQRWIGRDDRLLEDAYSQHLEILSAMESRDFELTESRLREHIRESLGAVLRTLDRAD